MTYSTQVYSGVAQLQSLLPHWANLKAGGRRLHGDLNLVHARICRGDKECEKLRVVGVWRDGALAGLSPVITEQTNLHGWRLRLPGKDVMLARFGMRQATFVGDSLFAPADLESQRALLRGLVDHCRDCHLIVFRNVNCEGSLYRLLREESWRPTWWRWRPSEPWSRWLVQFEGSFDDYLQSQFSAKRRHELRRERRRLEEACTQGLRLQVVTAVDEVEQYLAKVGQVVQASWQGKRHPGWPKGAKHLRALQTLAAEGLFRGYLLCDGDTPIAFACGGLVDGAYSPERTGFDVKWKEYSPGKHLWLSVIQDLFALEHVGLMDFGRCDLWYKQFFSNRQHSEAAVFLFRGHPRPIIAWTPAIVGRAGLSFASRTLRRFGLQASFHRLLFRLSRGRVMH